MVFIGAHISRETTLMGTIEKIKNNKGNALQIFASNPRGTKITNLNEKFFGNLNEIKSYINKNNFAIVIHNPYTINLATPFINGKKELEIKDCYWIQLLINELKIAHQLGSYGCVVHCGKYTKNTPEEGLNNMKRSLKFIITEIKRLKLTSRIILETSTGQGTELLYKYEDFLDFYNSFSEDDKNFLKICIDTCHIWAAGYELMEILQITRKNGNMKDIGVIHINNSKNPKESHLDRHEIIRAGYINLEEIILFIKQMKTNNSELILILETPDEKNLNEEIAIINK